MWSIDNYRYVFAAIGVLGVVVLFIPTVASFVPVPSGETFSELYLLGSERMMSEYPYNVAPDTEYTVYLGTVNHMGRTEYYRALVKFRNTTEPLPNTAEGTPSNIPTVYSYNIILGDGQTWERTLSFSVANVTFAQNESSVGSIGINGVWTEVHKSTLPDNTTGEYKYGLLVELWVYDTAKSDFVYHNRFVNLNLNMTRPA
ncbi:MAG: DUF1616 domain-containing protein [Candidatus Bathyarchaeia archaeon]